MAGHSKWAQIKHKKAATDAKKSKVFSKLVRFLTVEAKKAGGDRNAPGLRLAIEKARAANMPSENIDRAIERAASDGGAAMEAVLYEAYGPGGVAILMTGLTDNRNRSAAEIKHLLSKHGLSLAAPGSAAWAFTKTAEGYAPQNTIDLSDTDLAALEKLVDELDEHDDVQEISTNAS
jgi:YebC/PmpR family DNA-binding regulatory protein